MTIKVFGHKAPDTDATGSPIIWAWYLSEKRGEPAEPYLLGEPNTEAAFMLKRWSLQKPEVIRDVVAGDKVVIVDTNNPDELPAGITEAEIEGIIDHHKLFGGLSTKGPIEITLKPLACTATLMHQLMGDDADDMPDDIKGTMLSCIISDTLAFRSPTTTQTDRDLAERLADDLGLTISDYADEMFAAKSDVSGFSDEELIHMDSKVFDFDGKSLRISVMETTKPEIPLERKQGLMEAMSRLASEEGVDDMMFFIIDIIREEATLLVQNPSIKAIAEKSFGTKVDGDQVVLPGVMSRKKQIVPNLAV